MQFVPLCLLIIPIGFDEFFVVEKSFVFVRVLKLLNSRQLGDDQLIASPPKQYKNQAGGLCSKSL